MAGGWGSTAALNFSLSENFLLVKNVLVGKLCKVRRFCGQMYCLSQFQIIFLHVRYDVGCGGFDPKREVVQSSAL